MAIPIDSTDIQKRGCSEVISSNCVIWDGEDIPCLGICKGTPMTQAVYQEMNLVCSLLNQITSGINSENTPPPPIDFSVLNFGCAWSPTISTWTCPFGQVFVNTGVGNPPGYCMFTGTGSASAPATPLLITTPNPVPEPSTLLEVLQAIIDGIPCCDVC